ncbi:hypothetical protein N231_10585 [Geobacillus stearothermophilus ATCC 12980]|uniref:Uncharacterized protein n=1 Tax=Geobacillus stearothermophilus TaxID=1422 RepID=A0A150N0P3_GEOSE|nr:hypothetical protein GS8_159 [Geobacillus stearothermophilus]KOR93765.1 hypothetical protein N231_10585 [Geobacillus stearothermophilus ATCC 12980]KMY63049.1 hypothetical protein AA906_00800 [Geobacillus stearothermophilus]KYD30236.1 hypothetical protein B4109_0008 [Geobacillus stearothermophilus]RLP87941.1 hypothetical protein D9546_09700 [Geobacillus stearothermophilus]
MAFRLQVRGVLSFENACVCFYGESESETRLLGFPIAKVLLLQPIIDATKSFNISLKEKWLIHF